MHSPKLYPLHTVALCMIFSEEHLKDKELESKKTMFVGIGESIEDALSVDLSSEHVPICVQKDESSCGDHGRSKLSRGADSKLSRVASELFNNWQ